MPFRLNLPNKSSKLGKAPERLPHPRKSISYCYKTETTGTFTTNQTKSTNKLFEVSEIISEAPICSKEEETEQACLGAADAWSSVLLSVPLPAENAAY